MIRTELDPVQEARLLKKYRDHARACEAVTYIGPDGYHRKGAADKVFGACMNLSIHQGQMMPSVYDRGHSWWQCDPDCLTCYEQNTEDLRKVEAVSV